jgi:kynurenine formamidase
MRIIDLSHPIHPEIPVYPGTEPPVITPANSIARDGFAEIKIAFSSHTATHIDAPCHILTGAKSLDRFPAGHFVGPALLIDATGRAAPEIGIDLLEPYADRLAGAAFALLHTGWSRHWGQDRYFRAFPHLSKQAAAWLSRFPLRGVGIDCISVDPVERADLPAHHALLGRGMIIIENLTNLQALRGREFIFSCLPLPIRAADGSPVRAVAMLEDQASDATASPTG